MERYKFNLSSTIPFRKHTNEIICYFIVHFQDNADTKSWFMIFAIITQNSQGGKLDNFILISNF